MNRENTNPSIGGGGRIGAKRNRNKSCDTAGVGHGEANSIYCCCCIISIYLL